MNTSRIQQAIRDIEKCEAALAWLEQYGRQLTGRGNAQAGVTATLNLGSACTGAKEAASVISAYATLSLPDLVERSILSCHTTINIAKLAIREEAALPADEPDRG